MSANRPKVSLALAQSMLFVMHQDYLAAVRAALPAGVSFLDWYSFPVEDRLCRNARRRKRAMQAWEKLEEHAERLDQTVREMLEDQGIDLGPDPYDYPEAAP